MSTIKLKVPMSVNGMKTLLKSIKTIEKNTDRVAQWFIKYSLQYMREQANKHLQNTYVESSWYVRTGELESSWDIFANGVSGILRNMCPYSAYVEYGTGAIGKHPLADVKGYQYNINQHENGWYFLYDNEYHYTQGLEGYWYVYKAVYDDFICSKKPQELFDKAFIKVNGKINKSS